MMGWHQSRANLVMTSWQGTLIFFISFNSICFSFRKVLDFKDVCNSRVYKYLELPMRFYY